LRKLLILKEKGRLWTIGYNLNERLKVELKSGLNGVSPNFLRFLRFFAANQISVHQRSSAVQIFLPYYELC